MCLTNLWLKKNEAISMNSFNFYLFPPVFPPNYQDPSNFKSSSPFCIILQYEPCSCFVSCPYFPDSLNYVSSNFPLNIYRWVTSNLLRNQTIYILLSWDLSSSVQSIHASQAPTFSEILLRRWASLFSIFIISFNWSILSTYKI